MYAYFAKLRQNLEPNLTFDEIIQTRHAAVRQQLGGGDSHLIGSLQRKTRIQPQAGQTFDIDILIILDSFVRWVPIGGITPAAAVQEVLSRIQQSDRYALKSPAVDLPTVTLNFANEVKVELVPAYLDRVGHSPSGTPHVPKGRAYWVPGQTGSWELADYDYDASYISDWNARCDGYLVPVIKILKAIKRLHFPQLSSFALEILAARNIPYVISAHKEHQLTITYPALLQGFFRLALTDLPKPIVIPGTLSAPIVLTPEIAAQVADRFGAIQRAMVELESLADGKKVEYWRAIIGEQFPATL